MSAFLRYTADQLAGRVIDVHTHLGFSIKALAALEYPYAQSAEGLYYRQKANGVDVSVVFPFSPELFFDPVEFLAGNAVPARQPLSPAPFETENRMILREIYEFCPEYRGRFMPFFGIDPGREVARQVAVLEELAKQYPVYGMKVMATASQMPINRLLEEGRPLLDFARSRNLPLLFHATADPDEPYSHAGLCFEVIDANPDLRFTLAHCIGFLKEWLDRAHAAPNVWVDTSAFVIQVQATHDNNPIMAKEADRFPADYSSPADVLQRMVKAYPDTILWGTDSPYYQFISRRKQGLGDGPSAFREFRLKARYEDEKAALDSLPPEDRARISNRNTLRYLFGG